MTVREFLDGRVTLHAGDCLDVLKSLPAASVDSVVCDPPYHLTSIQKRYGKTDIEGEGTNEARARNRSDAMGRLAGGFMGKKWDGGDVAFQVATWEAVLRVLKSGGHLIAFSGTRTYHRMVCAIEDAGFEIRDQIGWAYGSGFPKSHDVSKGIDKRGGEQVGWFGAWLKTWRTERGLSQRELCERCGFYGEVNRGGTIANWELGLGQPTVEQFNTICAVLELPFKTMREAEREIVAKGQRVRRESVVQCVGISEGEFDITAPGTEAAKQWEGWGTALKPAWEPIVLARKPLIGTVAENVLQHGTGAINVDGCRVGTDGATKRSHQQAYGPEGRADQGGGQAWRTGHEIVDLGLGRWPANLVHDGSEEVLAAFPDVGVSTGGQASLGAFRNGDVYGVGRDEKEKRDPGFGDSGSAARFFYTAKADSEDRLGSKHPTVKPLDLMQWLVRLVTPKGGTCLDPFAGTGTTGEAAWREGMNAILIEREEEYQADIARRMDLATKPTKRRAVAKSKNKLERPEDTPLFANVETETAA